MGILEGATVERKLLSTDEGGHHRKGAARDRATAAAPPRQASEMRGRRRHGGQTGSPASRSGSRRAGGPRALHAHEVSRSGTRSGRAGAGARISVTRSRPCGQTGQRATSSPVSRSMSAATDSIDASAEEGDEPSRARHRAS